MQSDKLRFRIVKNQKIKRPAIVTIGLVAVGIIFAIGVPQLRLVGVHNDSLAIIEDTENGAQDLFEIGGDVFAEGRLVEVTSTHVVVMKDGEEVLIPLKAGISVAQTLEEMAAAVPNLFRDSDKFKAAPHGFLSAKTAPVVRDEQIVGFVLNEVSSDSLLAKWGLAKDDLVLKVNGNNVRGVFEALDEIRKSDGKSISIELERDGRKQSLAVS